MAGRSSRMMLSYVPALPAELAPTTGQGGKAQSKEGKDRPGPKRGSVQHPLGRASTLGRS